MSRRERATATPILNVNRFWENLLFFLFQTSLNNQRRGRILSLRSIIRLSKDSSPSLSRYSLCPLKDTAYFRLEATCDSNTPLRTRLSVSLQLDRTLYHIVSRCLEGATPCQVPTGIPRTLCPPTALVRSSLGMGYLKQTYGTETNIVVCKAIDKQKTLLSADVGHFSLVRAMHLADLITLMNGIYT